jgi:hypothetical protein
MSFGLLLPISASNTAKVTLGKLTPLDFLFIVQSKALTKSFHRSPMGMAAIGIALYKYVMKYSPNNCNYFNRDRFVLSNGILSMFRHLSAEVKQPSTQLTS